MTAHVATVRTPRGAGEYASSARLTMHASMTPGSRFITLCLAVLDPATGHVTYVNAGHPPALIVRPDGTDRLCDGGMALGLFEEATYDAHTAHLDEGDALVVYSDGITEAEDPAGRPFEEAGVEALLRSDRSTPIEQLGPIVFKAVSAYAQRSTLVDDLTLLAVQRRRGGRASEA